MKFSRKESVKNVWTFDSNKVEEVKRNVVEGNEVFGLNTFIKCKYNNDIKFITRIV